MGQMARRRYFTLEISDSKTNSFPAPGKGAER